MMEDNLSIGDLLQNRKWSFSAVDLLPSIGNSKDATSEAEKSSISSGKKSCASSSRIAWVKTMKLVVIY